MENGRSHSTFADPGGGVRWAERVRNIPPNLFPVRGLMGCCHLFSRDMMASYFFSVHKPWAIFNSAPELLPASAEKIRRLRPRWMLPFHLGFLDGELHRRRFAKLYGFEDWA